MQSTRIKIFTLTVSVLLIISIMLGMGMGAVSISPLQVMAILAKKIGISSGVSYTDVQESVLVAIRMPRVIMAVLIGSSLAISGAAMQGLFRNPLADPSLIGISSGASFAAVASIVLGISTVTSITGITGTYALSFVTFFGALVTAIIVYRLSQSGGKTIIATMLLAGIAINALAGAGTGIFTYAATDAQLRSITFWMLGSLGGASWNNVIGIIPFTLLPVFVFPFMAKALNAFSIGESNAAHLGTNTELVKRIVVLLTALCVGASVAVAGVISFVGLVVPHIIRLTAGPDNRYLLLLAPVLGALLLVSADLVARTLFIPAEVPIGIITSMIGAPVFLYMVVKELRSQRNF
ncbi:MAG TPA: iron ABC transporter permease [Chitinophagaceae bacterium]|nr:iron ABC transporter permease [Chitinophagaceae bacterium]